MHKLIRIGTRDSELALWQAHKVRKSLEELGYKTTIVPIKSTGDIILDKPLYELGITGIFTKNLDAAMLNGTIDIAVHSLKDVPTILPQGIVQAAVLKRANYSDVLVLKDTEEFFGQPNAIIASGSLRRKAQWLNRYPTHKVVDLRGNINTRLKKLYSNNWNGAIFAAAGLERLGKRPKGAIHLSWMIPAPAQGTIMVTALEKDDFSKDACEQLNHYETKVCTDIERQFLNILEGGCTSPIGAIAYIDEKTEEINFKGILLRRDGTKKITVTKTAKLGRHKFLAKDCADYIINKGGKQLILKDIKAGSPDYYNVYSTKKLSVSQKKLASPRVSIEDSDFIKIRFNRIPPKVVSNKIENVVFTSQNGVEAVLNNFSKKELHFQDIYCVGRRTKKLIESKIGKVTHAAKNAEKLAEFLSKEIVNKKITYFCGNLRLDVLPKLLEKKDILIQEVQAYKTMFSPLKIDDVISGVLFYSPSGIKSYLKENEPDKTAFCIGETTAKRARKYFKNVEVASLPTVESLLDLVNAHHAFKEKE